MHPLLSPPSKNLLKHFCICFSYNSKACPLQCSTQALCWQQGQPRSRFLLSMFVMLAETHEMSLWTGKTQIWACLALGHWSQVSGNSNSWFFSYTGSLSWKKRLEGSVMRSQRTNPAALGELVVQRKCPRCFVQHVQFRIWSEAPRVFWPLRMFLSHSLVMNFYFAIFAKTDFWLFWNSDNVV